MSTLSSIQQLAAAEIAIFGTLFFITGFIAIKHGIKGTMVWQMLVGVEVMRIIIGALHIAQNGNPRLYGAGVSFANSGTISLLVLVPAGLIYEVCLFIPTIGLWPNRINLALFHAIIIASIVMGTLGASPKDHSDTGDHSPTNIVAAKLGFSLLLVCLIILFAQGIYLIQCRVHHAASFAVSKQLKTLLYALFASLPFAMVRIGHEVAYVFDPAQERNTEVGDFTIIFFVVFLMQLFAVLPLVLGGFLTRNIGKEDLGLVLEESRRPFRADVELKDTREEVEEQHNRRRDLAWRD